MKSPTTLTYILFLLLLLQYVKIRNIESSTQEKITTDTTVTNQNFVTEENEKETVAKKEKVNGVVLNEEKSDGKTIKPKSLLQDKSDPFHDFPRVEPYECVNVTQRLER